MEEETFIIRIRDFFIKPWSNLEYWFAKRWLDKTFGKQEFWGEYLSEKLQQSYHWKECQSTLNIKL